MTTHVLEQSEALKRYSQRWKKQTLQVMALLAIILLAAWYVNVLNFELLANGLPAIGTLASEAFPPDFKISRADSRVDRSPAAIAPCIIQSKRLLYKIS